MEDINNEIIGIDDLDIQAYSDDDELLRNLLFVWGLPKLYEEFINSSVTLDDLRHINLEELKDLIPQQRIGERFRLRRHLEKWRLQNGYKPFYFTSTPQTTHSLPRIAQIHRPSIISLPLVASTPSREPEYLIDEILSDSRTSPETNQQPVDIQNHENLPLDQLLQSHAKGQSIIDYYREHKTLDALRKKLLVECIVSHYTNLVQRMTSSDVDYYTEWIIKLFPNENKDYYYVPRVGGKNARGKLYDKAANIANRLRAHGLIKSRFMRRTHIETTEHSKKNLQ